VSDDLWAGYDEESEPPDTAPAVSAAVDFWSARRSLQHLHTYARARRVAPWAVLGATLANVVAATEPNAQLPPTIGSYASLNLFVGLVGPAGTGKDAARKVAKEALELPKECKFLTAPLGSGEGLAHMFMREGKEGAELVNDAALVTIGEIDTLGALMKRQSSTVSSQLRQAAMGEELGFFYVDTAKRMMVPEHRYRMCLLAGIQPKRSGALLGDADGGTPQRFVWLPAFDPEAPDDAPDCPDPMLWTPPRWHEAEGRHIGGMYRAAVKLPRQAVDMVIAAHLGRTRGQGDALDGHALLTRLKVSTALGILEGRTSVDDEDWALSGHVMTVSDATRQMCVDELSKASQRDNVRQAEAEAARTIVVQERVDNAAVQRVARGIKRNLARNSGPVAHADLRKCLPGRDRTYFEPALNALVLAGDVLEEKAEHHNQHGRHYLLATGIR
jgi:hypothetical protein